MLKPKLGYRHVKGEAEGLWYLYDASNSINKLISFPEEFNPYTSYLGKGTGGESSQYLTSGFFEKPFSFSPNRE